MSALNFQQRLRSLTETALPMCSCTPHTTLCFVGEELRADKFIVLKCVLINGESLCHASKELKNDKEVVMWAVKETVNALQYASAELRNDREIALIASEPPSTFTIELLNARKQLHCVGEKETEVWHDVPLAEGDKTKTSSSEPDKPLVKKEIVSPVESDLHVKMWETNINALQAVKEILATKIDSEKQ